VRLLISAPQKGCITLWKNPRRTCAASPITDQKRRQYRFDCKKQQAGFNNLLEGVCVAKSVPVVASAACSMRIRHTSKKVGILEHGEGYFGRNPCVRSGSEKRSELMGYEDTASQASNSGHFSGFSETNELMGQQQKATSLAYPFASKVKSATLFNR
jgi:predicted nucleic acid-binding Zn ribbon protein